MSTPLIAEQFIEDARKATGLDDFGGDSFREGLEILLGDVNADNRPDELNARLRGQVMQSLTNRLKIIDYLKGRPELLQRPIEKPVFVFGIPRTGTTLLSNLLAADPARRSTLTWEIDEPVPPPTTATLYNDPRALARLEQERQMLAARPDAGKYFRSSAIYPNECVYLMAHEFKTVMWESRGKLPNYKDFIFSTDMTSAYEYHRKFLQLLQADAPGTWNLKMPSHALFLDTLLAIYPDARLVWTHRDPFTATGSFASLLSLAHMGFTGKVDPEYMGRNYSWQAAEHATRIMDWQDRNPDQAHRIIDVHYGDLMREPLAAMKKLYAAFGDEFTAEAEAGMQAWIDDNPQDKFGRHEYKLAQFGLSKEKLEPIFERYLSRHNVEREG